MEEEIPEYIKFINILLGIISITGCLLILVGFIMFKKIRSFVLELVFYLAFSCAMHTFAYIIYFPKKHSDPTSSICHFQAFNMLLFGDAQFIWSTLISFSIFQSVFYLKDISTKNSQYKRLIYLLIGFGIPLIMSIVGCLAKFFGHSGFWCYIKSDNDPNSITFFIINFTIIWLCILANCVFYIIVIRFIKQNIIEDQSQTNRKKYIYSLISYFVIQIICILPATINRLYQLVNKENLQSLQIMQSVFDCSQGLLYSIVYGLNPTVKEAIKSSLQNCFKNKNNSIVNSRKETEDDDLRLRSNIDFTRITLIDGEDDTIISD